MSGQQLTDLNSISPAERSRLAGLMLDYLTDEVVDAHVRIVHFGEQTFIGHHAYIEEMEAYLAANGGKRFVPLPFWDPAKPVPEEFNAVRKRDDGTPRPPLVNLNPAMPLPQRFISPDLCEFRNADDLGNEINPWHIHVHTTVGGTMGKFRIASAAPIFWCFHVFVGEVYFQWQRVCRQASS